MNLKELLKYHVNLSYIDKLDFHSTTFYGAKTFHLDWHTPT